MYSPEDHRWWHNAACAGTPLADWFPPTGPTPAATRMALRMCQGCPVRSDCLDAAQVEEQGRHYRSGIRGGLSANRRRDLDRAAHGTDRKPGSDGRTMGLEHASVRAL